MARVKTFTNGGSLLPGDLNSIEDDYEAAFSSYKIITSQTSVTTSGPTAATYVFQNEGTMVIAGPNAVWANEGIDFDPADFTANTRTTKLRVRAQLLTNAVAPATNWTVGLYPIATLGGASGGQVSIATLGTVVTGSTVLYTTPAAAGIVRASSGDFAMPAAGSYCFAVVNSGAAAAGSTVTIRADLQLRQV